MIRLADVWFVVHASIDEIDPDRLRGQSSEGKVVETGNMRFETHLLGDAELKERGINRAGDGLEWYTHVVSDLLDRIHFELTDRARASHSRDSWVFASRTDRRFDDDATFPNRWWPIERGAKPTDKAKASPATRTYAGGAGTTKVSRLSSTPGALLIEAHFAFAEPHDWFDGAPILRSKISLVAQDQVRQLRRELARQRTKPTRR